MSRARAYLQLVRLPNLFTAAADVLAGCWLLVGRPIWSWQLALLLSASVSLYAAGVIINDLRDIDSDRRQRPRRPLPAGRVAVSHARVLAIALCILGLLAAAAAGSCRIAGTDGSFFSTQNRGGMVATGLLAAVLAYNLLFKTTFLGPVCMGACRGLNLLLGMTCALPMPGPSIESLRRIVLILVAFFLYVASLTFFGRDEAKTSSRRRLVAGSFGLILAVLILGSVTAMASGFEDFALLMWLALLVHVVRVSFRAVRTPSPQQVQYAMKTFILGIVAFDAVLATAMAGWIAGVMVLGLLVPAMWTGRFVYST